MTEKYDIAFSLGFSCGCSRALRSAGLQFASYPLDWTGSPGIVESARMIANDFAGWLERDDLELVDVRAGRFGNHIYRNRKTRFGFPHEFSSFFTFDEAYGPTVEKHRRRIARLMKHMGEAKKVLVAYVERPINSRAPDADLVEARRILMEKFPGKSIDVLYFHCFPKDGEREFAEERIGNGITAVVCNYRRFQDGEVWHEIDYGRIAGWLREHVAVEDRRTEAEKAAYEEESRAAKRRRFAGGGPLRRKINELQYRLYRHLDEALKRKGLLPRERALWF